MSHLRVGDVVRLTGRGWNSASLENDKIFRGAILRVSVVDEAFNRDEGTFVTFEEDDSEEFWYIPEDPDSDWSVEIMDSGFTGNRGNLPDVPYYQFGDVQVKDISQHLTSLGGQALQYVARSTRLDGNNKGEQVKDLKKAIDLIQWEIERLEGQL